MCVALSTAVMSLGATVEVFDLTASVFASLVVAFVYLEIGSPYTYLVWLGSSLLSFIFFPASTVWIVHLFVFGFYPILKGYIEKLPRAAWLPLRLVYLNVALVFLVFLCERVVGVSFFGDVEGLPFSPTIIYIILWVAMNIAFVLYDFMLSACVRFYFIKLRPRFKNLLK